MYAASGDLACRIRQWRVNIDATSTCCGFIPNVESLHSVTPPEVLRPDPDVARWDVRGMTSHDARRYSLDRPGQLIAAIPAVLGFVPVRSVVLATVERGALGCVMRADLDDTAVDAALQMVEVAAASRPERAALVIVDDAGATCRMCRDDHRELARQVNRALEALGIVLWSAHVVDRIAVGGRWSCLDDCGSAGTVDDPSASPLAAAAVFEGRSLHGTRDQLADVIAVADSARSRALVPVIEDVMHDGGARPASAARRDVEHAISVAATLSEDGVITDDDVARLACALTDPRVRDTMYALAVGSSAAHAEALWTMLARVLPQPWRVEALVLLAFSAYVRCDGPLAGIALEAAKEIVPAHRMATLLDKALQSGMRPERIGDLAKTGYRLARRLGVQLPPRTVFGQRAG